VRLRVLIAALLLTPVLVGARDARADDYLLVRNAKNPTTRLAQNELRDMAVGKKKVWPHGEVVQLVLGASASAELEWFATVIVGVPEKTFRARVRQEVFKGEMRKPIIAANDRDCLIAVAADPGALGVVSAASAKKLPPEVVLVAVDAK
jgi:hypothetical protein